MIGDEIEIKIIDIKQGQVKIGVVAPKNVKVHRSEVYEEIQRENILAAKAPSTNDLSNLNNIFKGNLKKK
jgi:carbon storage regulator